MDAINMESRLIICFQHHKAAEPEPTDQSVNKKVIWIHFSLDAPTQKHSFSIVRLDS